MKKYFIIPLLLCSFVIFAKQDNTDRKESKINQFDDLGRKTGLWIVDSVAINRKIISYYKDGLEHGLTRIYDKGRLSFMGEMCNGMDCGTWYCFNNEFLIIKLENIRTLGVDAKGVTWLIGHFIGYFDSGEVHESGDMIWGSDWDWLIDWINVGEWTYISEDGKIRKEYFPELDPSKYLPLPSQP